MNSEKLNFQVKFWALIGPQISLLTLFVFFFKGATTPFALPLILLLGVPVCWNWKLKGFGASAVLLTAVLAYHYTEIPLEERFWHLGMGFSILMSLLITALSFEEVEALVEGVKVESRSRLENLWKVDEKLQQTTLELKKKKDKIREMNVKARSYQKVLDKSTEDLVEARGVNQRLKDELYQTKDEAGELQRRLAELEKQANPDAVQVELREQLAERERLLEEARRELFVTEEKYLSLQKEHEELGIYQIGEVEEALQKHLVKMEEEREQAGIEQELELDAIQDMLSQLIKSQSAN